MSTDTVPAVYEADVDEMTAGGLAVLGELRRRFIDAGTAASVLRVVDAYAAELALRAIEDDQDAGTRLCLVPDFGPECLRTALWSVQEFLGTVAQWERDPESEGWVPPEVLRGQAVEKAIERIREAVQPAETHTARYEGSTAVEAPPAGPSWETVGGYQLATLTFVALRVDDLAVLGAIAAELENPTDMLREAAEVTDEFLDRRNRERDGVIGSATRLHALFSLEPDADTTVLRQAALTATGDTVVLDRAQEDVWHRAVNRCYGAFRPDDVLGRWAMGDRHHD